MGIVHRDIKPANLFLAQRPDGSRIVKLLDFGISKPAIYDDGSNGSLTQTSAVIGSPRYMSPEQLRSSRDVDVRSDVWALGVTLFELLGATSPFARGTMPEVCASILKDPPLKLTEIRPELPSGLEAVIVKCLAKDPKERWKDVGELAVALRAFGPLGIVDISVERIVGVINQAESAKRPSRPPPFATSESGPNQAPLPRSKTPTGDRTTPVGASMAEDSGAVRRSTPTPPAGTPNLSLKELEATLFEQLGGKRRVPKLAIDPHHITLLALDHKSGFLLSLVDGKCTLDEILDIAGLPRVDALRILSELREKGVLKIG